MKSNKYEIITAGIVLLFFATAGYFYPRMPELLAFHWDARGQVDGYMSRFWGLFLMPFISVGLVLLFALIPRLDPLRANIATFKKSYYWFVIAMLLFFFYLYLLTVLWNTGARFNMMQLLVPAFGILLYGCGILIEKAKRNWSIGIRTPWTLSNEKVWDKTHRIGGELFKATGIIALAGIFFESYAIFFILIPVILVSAFTIIYSYLEYQKETRAT